MTVSANGSQFESQLEAALDAVAESWTTRLDGLNPDLRTFLRAARDFVRGGKRLRARFCQAGWLVAGGGVDDPRIARAGAAFEWLQGSALVHDDLMDGSDLRRGRPSLHREFEQRHRSEGRSASAAAYGAQVAVLAGDLMLSWADEALRTAAERAPDWQLDRAAGLWDAAKTEVVAGQFLDISAQTRDRLSLEDAMTVVRFKAAKYTVERPLHVGAALAGASDALLEGLSEVAVPLGEAFQLRDDLLGVFGEPSATGKPAGDDLREGKRTFLVARTAQLGDAELLFRLLGTDDGVEELAQLMRDCGAAESVEADIDRLAAQALAAVARLGEPAGQVLEPLVRAAVRRDR